MYSNVVDYVVAAIRTLSSSGILVTYSCGGPGLVFLFLFSQHKVFLVEGEKCAVGE